MSFCCFSFPILFLCLAVYCLVRRGEGAGFRCREWRRVWQLSTETSPDMIPRISWSLLCCVSGFGFRISDFGFRVSGFGFRVPGFGFRILGFGFRISGFWFRISSFGFWGSCFVFRLSCFWFLVSVFLFSIFGFQVSVSGCKASWPGVHRVVFELAGAEGGRGDVSGFGCKASCLGVHRVVFELAGAEGRRSDVSGFGFRVSGFGFLGWVFTGLYSNWRGRKEDGAMTRERGRAPSGCRVAHTPRMNLLPGRCIPVFQSLNPHDYDSIATLDLRSNKSGDGPIER